MSTDFIPVRVSKTNLRIQRYFHAFCFLVFLSGGGGLPDTGSNLEQADQHTLSTFTFVTGLIHYESLKAQVFS